jgi:hypothetical protein
MKMRLGLRAGLRLKQNLLLPDVFSAHNSLQYKCLCLLLDKDFFEEQSYTNETN